jgi:hypothetical protein
MADTTSAIKDAKPAEREVRIDVRSLILAAILNAGERGLLWDNFCWNYTLCGIQQNARTEISELLAEGIITKQPGQIGTGGTSGDFYVLAPGVKYAFELS